jgi:hypothetical protein
MAIPLAHPTSLHHPQIRGSSVNEFTLCEMIWDD